ncbi:pentapeptide repeat-containing protein [Streptomyces sp. NPDC018057]|uniref:pentapeptide repeat-containing protein n=1 Tax=unclassified Streptomyces TaxID=2593676 RepID=UPI0037A34F22
MSSGTRKGWAPARFPSDAAAAERLREWIEAEGGGLDAIALVLDGADISHGDFSESWFSDAKLRNVRLVDSELYRSDMQGADMSGSDLSGCSLVRVNLDDAILRDATLDGANLVKASLYDVDAAGAKCRGTQFAGSSLLGVDFRGADLSDSTFDRNSFRVTLDQETRLVGASGSVIGPVVLVHETSSHELGGQELEEWITSRGGRIQVVSPARQR